MSEQTTYRVVVNHEEQYAIWPVRVDVPAGWLETGFIGERDACLQQVERVWTDMRPPSLREERA